LSEDFFSERADPSTIFNFCWSPYRLDVARPH